MGELSHIATPCVLICSLNDDDICVGCLRSLDEIGQWGDADRNERLKILDNATERGKTIDVQW